VEILERKSRVETRKILVVIFPRLGVVECSTFFELTKGC